MFPLEWWIKWEICDVLYNQPLLLNTFQVIWSTKVAWSYNKHEIVQIKDKENLNRIIKNQPITHVTLLFLFEIQ